MNSCNAHMLLINKQDMKSLTMRQVILLHHETATKPHNVHCGAIILHSSQSLYFHSMCLAAELHGHSQLSD